MRYPQHSSLLIQVPLFQVIQLQYPPRYHALLGSEKLGYEQACKIHDLLIKGELYAGSDGLETDNIGAHTYGFTSSRELGRVWGGATLTLGNVETMTLLSA